MQPELNFRLRDLEQPDSLRIIEYSESNRNSLLEILSDRTLLERLYPQTHRPPPVTRVIFDWTNAPLNGQGYQLAIMRSADDRLLGCVRLDHQELSYFIDRPFWGQGYGARAMKWVSENILSKSKGALFHAFTERDNLASIRLLESAGCAFSGLTQQCSRFKTLLQYRLRT